MPKKHCWVSIWGNGFEKQVPYGQHRWHLLMLLGVPRMYGFWKISLPQSTTWDEWGKNHTIHVFVKLKPMKEHVKQTSWLKLTIVTPVIKSLSSQNWLNLLKVSAGKPSFSYFKMSPIKLTSHFQSHRILVVLGTVHVRKPSSKISQILK